MMPVVPVLEYAVNTTGMTPAEVETQALRANMAYYETMVTVLAWSTPPAVWDTAMQVAKRAAVQVK